MDDIFVPCRFRLKNGETCGKKAVKFYKHGVLNAYIGYCEEHSGHLPNWPIFKPVSLSEVVIAEVIEA